MYAPGVSPESAVKVVPPSSLYFRCMYGVLPSAPGVPGVPLVPSLTVCVCVPSLSVMVMVVVSPDLVMLTVGDTPSTPESPFAPVTHTGVVVVGSDPSEYVTVDLVQMYVPGSHPG